MTAATCWPRSLLPVRVARQWLLTHRPKDGRCDVCQWPWLCPAYTAARSTYQAHGLPRPVPEVP